MQGSCFRTFRGQATAIATLGGKKGRRETEYLGLPPFARGLKLNAVKLPAGGALRRVPKRPFLTAG